MPTFFLDEEDESKALFTLTTISRLYSFTFLFKKQKQKQKNIFSLFTGALVSSGAKTKLSLKGMLELWIVKWVTGSVKGWVEGEQDGGWFSGSDS